jgi:L-ascorbate metabolism protein UlaG (beta-lactamase superfamily)
VAGFLNAKTYQVGWHRNGLGLTLRKTVTCQTFPTFSKTATLFSMHITWHGQYTIKIQVGETTIVIDPYSPTVGLSAFRGKADIVALSHPSNPDMSHFNSIQGMQHLINTPGEYALSGVTLNALGWHAEDGSERSLHRWYIDGMVILYVGALNREITDYEFQELEKTNVDVLFVPVGGGDSLTTDQALKLITKIEPRVVIPIHYQLPGLKEKLDSVDRFAKEMGVDPNQKEKKLTIKASKIPQEDMVTVILAP